MNNYQSESALTAAYLDFLKASPTSYHAAAAVAAAWEAAGATRLDPAANWELTSGRYFIARDGAVIGFALPAHLTTQPERVRDFARFRLVGAHTDSPALKVKPQPDSQTKDGWGQIGVEIYGGIHFNAWLDRDLKLAGRVIDTAGVAHLVETGPIATIPQLAPHLDRTVDEKGLRLNPQKHLHPVWYATGTTAGEPRLLDLAARAAGLGSAAEIAGHDLYLVPAEAPALIGEGQQFLAGARQDNLSSSFPAAAAFAAMEEPRPEADAIPVVALFDHEEVGSLTATGADSDFLRRVLERLVQVLSGADPQAFARVLARSTAISADAGHLVNPNYPDKHDPDTRPLPGGGVLLKINAKQRYATDARGEALWRAVCERAGAAWQNFVSSNDVPCGTTIGPITAGALALPMVDVGIGLLSMHSPRELSAPADLYSLYQALGTYLGAQDASW